MKFLILSLFLIFSFFAKAETLGQMRITVIQKNPQHITLVKLYLMQQEVASFSHATSSTINVDVDRRFLSMGTSTPLRSSYSDLQHGCEFDFRIEFSTKNGGWINLGTYHAPTSAVNKSIPLGLCQDNLCSNDANIQRQIKAAEEALWKSNAEAIRNWLEDSIQKEQEALRLLKEQALANQKSIEMDVSIDDTFAKIDQDLQTSSVAQTEVQVPNSLQPQDIDQTINAAINNGTIDNLITENEDQKKFIADCLSSNSTTKYLCRNYGGWGWVGATAETIAIALSTNPQSSSENLQSRILDPSINSSLNSALERNSEMRFRIQNALDIKRSEQLISRLTEESRLAIAFSPLNDIVDFCEAITGRMMCMAKGTALSSDQRVFAALGVIAGNRAIWQQISSEMKLNIFSNLSKGMSKAETEILMKDLEQAKIIETNKINQTLAAEGIYTNAPYMPNKAGIEFTPSIDIKNTFTRVYADEKFMASNWIIDKSSIEGKTRKEIKNILALEYEPKYIVDVHLPANEISIRAGPPNRIFDAKGQQVPVQYEIISDDYEKIKKYFKNQRELK